MSTVQCADAQEITIPKTAPATFRGESISYVYKVRFAAPAAVTQQVVLGIHRPGHPAKSLRIPLRVLPLLGWADCVALQSDGNIR